MTDLHERLETYLTLRNQSRAFEQLTPDASTREYFRIGWNGGSAIACVYPEPFVAAEQSYLDVTNLFLSNGLPVANVLDFDERLGIIVQEDLGDTILRDGLTDATDGEREKLIDQAIGMIAKIQLAAAKRILRIIGAGGFGESARTNVHRVDFEIPGRKAGLE